MTDQEKQIDVIIGVNTPSPLVPGGSINVVRLTGTGASSDVGELVVSDGERIVAGFAVGGWVGWYRTESNANPVTLPAPEAGDDL